MGAIMRILTVLVSLAMAMLGAPVNDVPGTYTGRTMTIENATVKHNGESAALAPTFTLAAMTDGRSAACEGYVSRGEERRLSFQAVSTDDHLLIMNDDSGVTLRLDGQDLEKLAGELGMLPEGDAEAREMLEFTANELLPAYAGLLRLVRDEAAMAALEQRAQAIYDEGVERGAGTPGPVEYEGALHDAMNYDYTLTGAQLGALCDAACAENDAVNAYVAAYFRLLDRMPEETGLSGVHSYAELLERLDVSMRVSESIADDGLTTMDCVMDMAAPNVDAPLRYNIHEIRMGDMRFTTVLTKLDIEGIDMETYAEVRKDGRDIRSSATVSINADDAAQALPEGEGDAPGSDGEGDAPDMVYVTMDCELSHEGDPEMVVEAASLSVDLSGANARLEVIADGRYSADGIGASHIAVDWSMDGDAYGADFDVAVTGETFDLRAAEAGAQSLDGFDAGAVLQALAASADALFADETVQQAAALLTPPASDGAAEADAYDGGELPFARPVFDWLPEGYAVSSVNVDREFDEVTCTLRSATTGDEIAVSLTPSYESNGVKQYVVNGDNFSEVDGMLVTEYAYDGERIYTADDGSVNLNIVPTNPDTPATDILNILIGLRFEAGEEE